MKNKRNQSIDPSYINSLYNEGVEYKNSIGLYSTVRLNERFFAGDQWVGVNAPDLPKPVVNFIKRAVQQKVAEVNSNPVAVTFEAPEFPSNIAIVGMKTKENDDTGDDPVEIINTMFDNDWNRMKMDALNLDGLLDAAISGDFILYNYWNPYKKTGQAAEGQICTELIDNVNFYPGNPNCQDVQKQTYIIISRREPICDVIAEAKANGLSEYDISSIMSDGKNEHQSGDMARCELSGSENSKCLTLTYLFRGEDGNIYAEKTAGNIVIRPLFNTRLTRFPISIMNWERRKNCLHGRAEITGLIPVQRYINQMYAMAMLFTMQSACPKPIFNQGMVKTWSNAIGAAIPVNGNIDEAIKYLNPPTLPNDVYTLPERMMNSTLSMVGVSNIDLGNVKPTNTSAIVLAREATLMPVRTIKQRFYSLIEDFARNWLDMVLAFETVPRWVKKKDKGGTHVCVFDPDSVKDRFFSVNVEVGAATEWSEINSVSTLNSLLSSGVIDARQYIERLPEGYIPMREKLLSEFSKESPKVSLKGEEK